VRQKLSGCPYVIGFSGMFLTFLSFVVFGFGI